MAQQDATTDVQCKKEKVKEKKNKKKNRLLLEDYYKVKQAKFMGVSHPLPPAHVSVFQYSQAPSYTKQYFKMFKKKKIA